MNGLDTNIIIRFLTKDDDDEQYKKSFELLTQNSVAFLISYPTLVEMIWVLERRYEYAKKELIFVLEEFIDTENFYFPNRSIIDKSIKSYKNSNADFADCLIGIMNKEHNCETTYTFDKQASQLSSYTLLE